MYRFFNANQSFPSLSFSNFSKLLTTALYISSLFDKSRGESNLNSDCKSLQTNNRYNVYENFCWQKDSNHAWQLTSSYNAVLYYKLYDGGLSSTRFLLRDISQCEQFLGADSKARCFWSENSRYTDRMCSLDFNNSLTAHTITGGMNADGGPRYLVKISNNVSELAPLIKCATDAFDAFGNANENLDFFKELSLFLVSLTLGVGFWVALAKIAERSSSGATPQLTQAANNGDYLQDQTEGEDPSDDYSENTASIRNALR